MPRLARRLSAALWWGTTLVLLGLVARGLTYRVTWYLGVDQYGYLTFADDLAHGRLFHRWPPLDALAPRLPRVVDVLAQSYVADQGKVYCRYAPGFPLLLAAWIRLFGEDAAHALSPCVFLALLTLVLAFQRRLFASRWQATAGLALLLLARSSVSVWATAILRDLAAHAAGLLGLFLLLPARGRPLGGRRAAAAGLALGYAGSIRPDAALYVLPALLLAAARRRDERAGARRVGRALGAGLLGLLLGLAPLLAYNWATTGNPLRPTQGMEADRFLPAQASAADGPKALGFPPPAWRGGTAAPVQGGGLRLANLPRTLPGTLLLVRLAYGDVVVAIALWGVLLALVHRRALFLAAVAYVVPALLLYSCWSRPSARYLVGVHLFLPMLVVEGTFGTLDLARRLAFLGRGGLARALALGGAAALGAAAVFAPPPLGGAALPMLARLVPGLGAVAALATAVWPRIRVTAVAAPALALALAGLATLHGPAALSQVRAAFQGSEMRRARDTLARTVAPGSVVIATETVGRPAENIDRYSVVANAFYTTDLVRWRLRADEAVWLLAGRGIRTYLLIPRDDPARAVIPGWFGAPLRLERVADIPAAEAMAYFVADPFGGGAPLELYRLGVPGAP